MPGLRTEEMPAEVAALRDQVAEFTGTPVTYEHLMVFDHAWEGLRPGAYSIALEGHYGWSTRFVSEVYDGKREVPAGWEVYRGTGYRLDIYPADAPTDAHENVLPCGCVPHKTRMTDHWGFYCDTEQQPYCNFECPHEDED